MGFTRLHVVDLDGARSKHIVNVEALRAIAEHTRLTIDFGGGIKSDDDLEQAFAAGAHMVTVGSIAVSEPERFLTWLERYGADKLILGADVRDGRIAVNGWKEDSREELIPFLRRYVERGVRNVLCTDISKDGMLQGPAIELYQEVMKAFPQFYEGRLAFESMAKRIIPCLDVKDGMTVKGTNFVNLRAAGDPVELGKAYSQAGADELVFLDITASHEGRKTFTDMVSRVASEINIPFTVGGGINELSDVDRLLGAGADKVSVNSAALRHPELIDQITSRYGSQVCVCAIDARLDADGWHCYVKGGRERVERGLFEWAREVEQRGAGEILFTSMNHDGVKNGYANEALARLSDELSIPVIASGGAGTMEHFRDAFALGKADAALAASVFHFGEISIHDLKEYLWQEGINVRRC